jgi:hypothetical protein
MNGIPAILFLTTLAGLTLARAVEITEINHQGRPHFKIETSSATCLYDRSGGGFSRLVDVDGNDWIAFQPEPLNQFPASAAAGYRGLPNLLFGKNNPDAGAGHPGFDQCSSSLAGERMIRSETKSGRWAWTWSFSHTNAIMRMERADPEHPFWFLYEGPVAGSYAPRQSYWGTDLGGPRFDTPDLKNQLFGTWRWAYFGSTNVSRVFFAAQIQQDDLPDTMWYMGNTAAGLDSPDGMVVFGFGRGPGTSPRLKRLDLSFVIGFIERMARSSQEHDVIAAMIESHLNR